MLIKWPTNKYSNLRLNTLNDNFLAWFMRHAWKHGLVKQLSRMVSNVEGPKSKSIGWGLHRKHDLRWDWFCNSFWSPEARRYSPKGYIIYISLHIHYWYPSRFNPVLHSVVQLSNNHAANNIRRFFYSNQRRNSNPLIPFCHSPSCSICSHFTERGDLSIWNFDKQNGHRTWKCFSWKRKTMQNHAKPFPNIYRPWSLGYFWEFQWFLEEVPTPTLSHQVAAHADLVHQHRHQRQTTDFLRCQDTMETTFP